MILQTTKNIPQGCNFAIRFVQAGQAVSFAAPALQAAYTAALPADDFKLRHGQIQQLRLNVNGAGCPVLLAGFDSANDYAHDEFRDLLRRIGIELHGTSATAIFVDGLEQLNFAPQEIILEQLGCALPLCDYAFDRHLSKKAARHDRIVYVLCDGGQSALDEGLAQTEGIIIARDLVNESADVLTPMALAQTCADLGAKHGFEVEILDKAACQAQGMNLLLAVASGSRLEPCCIVMRYRGGGDEAPIGLVGKGITYDSGGMAIKTGGGMHLMRFDMNGAAAVIGAMCAIADRKLPANVVGVVAATENMVDACSVRNGDIVTSMNGKTVYIQNTDAEGRITMADAMTYCIRNEHPCELLEVAGLTGSVCKFYGKVCAAAMTSDPALFARVERLSSVTGEKYALMPNFREHAKMIQSPFADLTNSAGGDAGGITAGHFMMAFREDTPFMHVDFGATPFVGSAAPGQPAGGTGFGVKTLYQYVKLRCAE